MQSRILLFILFHISLLYGCFQSELTKTELKSEPSTETNVSAQQTQTIEDMSDEEILQHLEEYREEYNQYGDFIEENSKMVEFSMEQFMIGVAALQNSNSNKLPYEIEDRFTKGINTFEVYSKEARDYESIPLLAGNIHQTYLNALSEFEKAVSMVDSNIDKVSDHYNKGMDLIEETFQLMDEINSLAHRLTWSQMFSEQEVESTENDQIMEKEEQTKEGQSQEQQSADPGNSSEDIEQSNESNKYHFDEEAIQSNNEKIKDPEFLSLASKGQIKGINVPLHVPIGPAIENQIGNPDSVVETEGGYYLMYNECHCGFGVGDGYKEYPEIPISSYYLPINLSREDIIHYLGEPNEEGYSEVDSGYYLYYDLGEYKLFVDQSVSEPTTAPFDSITLK